MNIPALNSKILRWRDVGRWLLFFALALGFAKTPLAYSCPPQFDHAGHSASHAGSTDNPCHHPLNHRLSPGEQDRDCCLLDIDNGLRGGESGFPVSQLLNQQPVDQPAADLAEAPRIAGERHPTPAIPVSAGAFPVTKHPPYLLTLRLRL